MDYSSRDRHVLSLVPSSEALWGDRDVVKWRGLSFDDWLEGSSIGDPRVLTILTTNYVKATDAKNGRNEDEKLTR
jgi:hypothetical protein